MKKEERIVENYCSHCKLIVKVYPGYYYWKCSVCYNPIKLSFKNRILNLIS